MAFLPLAPLSAPLAPSSSSVSPLPRMAPIATAKPATAPRRTRQKFTTSVRAATTTADPAMTAAPTNLPDLPANLTAHALLTPSQEHELLRQIRFLQTEKLALEQLTTISHAMPSELQLASALLLSPDELSARRHAALRARNHLVSANLRLVTSIAKTVYRSIGIPGRQSGQRQRNQRVGMPAGVSHADLVQEGSIALIRAAECFDLSLERCRFSTYASRAIWTACQRAAMPSSCIVYLPHRLRLAVRKLRAVNAQRALRDEPPVAEERFDEVLGRGAPKHLVQLADLHLTSGVSLDEEIGNDDGRKQKRRRMELLQATEDEPEEVVDWWLVRESIKTACFRALSKRDASVVMMRFGLGEEEMRPMLVREVASEFGVTSARVTQIVTKALQKLRTAEPELAALLDVV